MASLLQSIRGKVPTKRTLFALGGVAAVALGVAQTTDTMAAGTDSATAKVSQIATQNFTPVPVVQNLACSTSNGRFNMRWTDVPTSTAPDAQYSYYVEAWEGGTRRFDGNTSVNNYNGIELGSAAGRRYYQIRVFTRWGPSGGPGELSEGYAAYSVYMESAFKVPYCNGYEGRLNISNWQEQANWTPAEPAVTFSSPNVFGRRAQAPTPSTPSTAPSSESATPSTSTTAPETSTETTTSSSTPKESTSTSEAPAADPEVTMGIEASGTDRELIVYQDGAEQCRTPMGKGDVPNVGNNEVTLTTEDGAVKKVDPDTCKVS